MKTVEKDKEILYSLRQRNPSLPHPKDLISETADPMKEIILSYLRENIILGCPGIIYDEINPQEVIGCGNIFSDGTYRWDDVFTNYVDRYNMQIPETFRNHILENYTPRKKRAMLFQLIDQVIIDNNPFLGCHFKVCIAKNGVVRYQSADTSNESVLFISPKDAEYIINPITKQLFCYDTDAHGTAMTDGYHWSISFLRHNTIVDTIEGYPGEERWRFEEVLMIVRFAERYIPKDLGANWMSRILEDQEKK